jgi:hypothetical protein
MLGLNWNYVEQTKSRRSRQFKANGDSSAHFRATRFRLRTLARRSALPKLHEIKSPNSGNRTPRISQKTNTGDLLKSPKNQLFP